MPLSPGDKLGQFDVLSLLGRGGMGEVYRARDTQLKREVALKVLPAAFSSDPDRLARFQREAELLASLDHPNIGHIYGMVQSERNWALVLALIEGPTLDDRIKQGPLPVDEAIAISKQIIDALEYAHEHGVIHRDLKPANIKVTPDGVVKVLDFGLAKALDQRAAPTSLDPENSPTLTMGATQAGVIMGTAAYMSPEQAVGKAADRRSDIFSFGVVLYEMLVGKRPFRGESMGDTLAAVVKDAPDWSALPAETPSHLKKLLERMLAKDRKERLQAIGEARIALARLQSDEASAQQAPPPVQAKYSWPWIAAGLVSALALALAAVSFLYFRETPEPRPLVRFIAPPPAGAVRHFNGAFSISPDGQLLAFVANGSDGIPRIYLRHIDSPDAQPLAGTEHALISSTGLVWAPDSRSLAFPKDGALYRSDLSGGPPKRLCDVPGTRFGGGTWSPSGVIVFAGTATGLFRVPDTGGALTTVTTLDASAKEESHFGPWFLPDGRHILFLVLATGQSRGTIWATSIDNPARTRITESSGPVAYSDEWLLTTTVAPRSLLAQPFDPERLKLSGAPQPVRDGLVAPTTGGGSGFAVAANGTLVVDRPPPVMSQLTWMDRTGRAVASSGARANITSFALAPDERRIVAEIRDNDAGKSDLWLFDGEKESGTRLTFGDASSARPLWALDGRHVYLRQGNGTQLFQLRTLTIGAPAVTPFENPGPFVAFEDVTRDGRYIVFKSLKAPPEIWIQRVGSAERRALVQDPFGSYQARVSRDSRWLAYELSLPSGPEVFAQPFDRPGERVQVSVKGGFGPLWRDDGRELYYEGPEGLMAVPMTERNGMLEAGTPQKLFSIHTQGLTVSQPHNVEVAADGQKLLVNTIIGDSDNDPLEVTLNWQTGLKK